MITRTIVASALLASALAVTGCASGQREYAQITGVTWVADNIGGTPALPDSEVTLIFNPDGRSGGKGGCNTYGAGYKRNGDALTFEQAMSTQMFCAPDALMAQEHAYLDLLPQVVGFERTGDKLKLNTPDKSILFHVQQ